MSWPDPADPLPAVRARLVSARGSAAVARATVAACRPVPWVAAAADAYRSALDDERWRLDRLVGVLEALLAEVRLPGPWPTTTAEVVAGSTCWGDGGRSVRLGAGAGGFVAVDPEALADAGARLGRAAAALDEAATDLVRAQWGADQPWQSGGSGPAVLGGRVAALMRGPFAPAGAADRLRDLGATTRAVARVHAAGEASARTRLRWLAGYLGHHPAAAAVEMLPALLVVGARAELAAGRVLLAGGDPVATLVRSGEQVWSDAAADGDVELAVTGIAAALDSVAPAILQDPVPVASTLIATLLARGGGDVALVPRADPPQLPPPHGLAGVLDVVAKSYDESQPTGLPGTPTATVTVERLDHPDGSRSWVVAVPGTQSWLFSEGVATDMGTNLQLVGGLADPMTAGVVAAMAAAGIGPDEPVVLAGHSQGGMVAMSVAAVAAGAYRIGGVVTAGSPSVPARLRPGVPVVRLEHDEDVVPQTDGAPTAAGGDITRVTRSLADDHPALPAEAHEITGYLATAQRVDGEAAGSAPGITAVSGLLGGDGTTATTFQYRVTRAGGDG